MSNVVNLDNGGERFNICLEPNGNLNFKANAENCAGTNVVTINDDSKNVGIGTTNPAQRLHVQGNRVRLENGGRILDLRADGSEIDIETGTNSLFIKASGTGNHVVFNPFAANGNVGIGLTNPQAPLQVRGRLGLENETGAQLWNLNVDNSGNLSINANSVTGGTTRLFINDDSGNVGIGTTSPTQKLHVAGSICYTGSIGACSDLRYKTDIEPLTDSLNKVLSMHGMRYQWNQEAFPNHAFGEEPQIGFSGQEVEAICPEVVSTDSEGYKYLDYSRLTPVLVEAIKEQQQFIEQQKSVLGEALAKIAQLEVTVQNMNADS
ncbi:MAG: tail fiber domain-containing protein [Cyanobacteriota bacterium]|nr:tail fiber domain-containing protein [Cyanobacteriota bacterium]